MIRSLIASGLTIAATILLAQSSVAGQPTADLIPARSISIERSVAEIRVSDGWVVLLHRKPGSSWPVPGEDRVTVLDAQGTARARIVPSDAIPDARMVNVQHAEARDATLFVSAIVSNDSNRFASVILRYQLPAGTLDRVIRTNPIECPHITMDAASIWCLGPNIEQMERSSRDFHLLYRFSHDGVLQESGLSWSRDLPRASRPWAYGQSGPPSLRAIPGGVRIWLPNGNRVITWIPGQKLEVTEIPADLLSSEAQDVVDDGRTMIVSSFQQPLKDRVNRVRRITLWDVDATPPIQTPHVIPVGRRIVGHVGTQLLIWDRDAQRLEWVVADWIK